MIVGMAFWSKDRPRAPQKPKRKELELVEHVAPELLSQDEED